MVVFEPVEHKYKMVNKDIELKSVSKLISMVKPEFDKEYWSNHVAKKRGITQEEVLKEWAQTNKEALAKGTKYHEYREEKFLKNKAFPAAESNGLKVAHDLSNLPVGIHPELMLYNFEYMLAGTSDIVEILPDKRFILGDFKSNKKLEFEGYKKFDKDYKEKRAAKMKFPLQHLDDANGIHYTIQLSIYAYMLEQFGYHCHDLYIDHIIFDGDEPVNEIRYPIQYLKKEVINLLNWYKTQK